MDERESLVPGDLLRLKFLKKDHTLVTRNVMFINLLDIGEWNTHGETIVIWPKGVGMIPSQRQAILGIGPEGVRIFPLVIRYVTLQVYDAWMFEITQRVSDTIG